MTTIEGGGHPAPQQKVFGIDGMKSVLHAFQRACGNGLRRTLRLAPLFALALLAAAPLRADDVCSDEEHRKADAALARAQAAESAGDLKTALKLVNSNEVRGCGDGKTAMALMRRISAQLGRQAEAAGDLAAAFDFFRQGGWLEDAQRVGLKRLAAAPEDIRLASDLMDFMQRNGFEDGASAVRDHSRQQAQKLLADEEAAFSIRTPRRDLLEKARDWLALAGDQATPLEERALKRGDAYLALDYAFALQQAMDYYTLARREQKIEAVRAKARHLADGLAGGDNWAAAVELYNVAGDLERARELTTRREASAADAEKLRREQFQKDQDDLEKELDI